MNSRELKQTLAKLLQAGVRRSVLIKGAPGIAKSAVVAQVAAEAGFKLIDLRLSQLMPSDLRGLPIVDTVNNQAVFARPEFLPPEVNSEVGYILLLDEFANSSPTMMALAQELILDYRVGSHKLPSNCYVWAISNRKQDNAGTNALPSSVANRFIHLEIEPDLDTWIADYAVPAELDSRVVAFLRMFPHYFHKYDAKLDCWPSARTWEMASELLGAGVSIQHAVGPAVAAEFSSWCRLYDKLPDLDAIMSGKLKHAVAVRPTTLSVDIKFATVSALEVKVKTARQYINTLNWLVDNLEPEYVNIYWMDTLEKVKRTRGMLASINKEVNSNSKLKQFVARLGQLSNMR